MPAAPNTPPEPASDWVKPGEPPLALDALTGAGSSDGDLGDLAALAESTINGGEMVADAASNEPRPEPAPAEPGAETSHDPGDPAVPTSTPPNDAVSPASGLSTAPTTDVLGASPPEPTPPAVAADADLADLAETVAAEVRSETGTPAPAAEAGDPTPDISPQPAPSAPPKVAAAVEIPPATPPASPSAPLAPAAAVDADNIQSLDSDLAALTESMLADDDVGRDTTAPPVPSAPSTAEPASVPPPPAGDLKPDTTPKTPAKPEASAPAQPAPKPTSSPAAAAAPTPPSAPASRDTPTPPAKTRAPARERWSAISGSIGHAAGRVAPGLVKALGLASIPLRGKPPIVRHAIGIVGVWTLMLAGMLWTYLLLFHKPGHPAPMRPTIAIAEHQAPSPDHVAGPGSHESSTPQSRAPHGSDHSRTRPAPSSPHQSAPHPSAAEASAASHAQPSDDHATEHAPRH